MPETKKYTLTEEQIQWLIDRREQRTREEAQRDAGDIIEAQAAEIKRIRGEGEVDARLRERHSGSLQFANQATEENENLIKLGFSKFWADFVELENAIDWLNRSNPPLLLILFGFALFVGGILYYYNQIAFDRWYNSTPFAPLIVLIVIAVPAYFVYRHYQNRDKKVQQTGYV